MSGIRTPQEMKTDDDELRGVWQARLAAIVESSDDAIISKTLDGVITSWNQSAERLFGHTAEEAIGKHITIIVPPDRHSEEVGILAKLRNGESISHFETRRLRKDGKEIEISLSVSPLRNHKGKLIGASKIARDITEAKRLEAAREELFEKERNLRENAQRVNILKDEFLATLSHELRTPLNAILGWAQLLARGNMDPVGIKQAAEVLGRSARMQKQLIDDLLDMSRIISGKLRVEICEIDPILFIGNAVEAVRAAADAKNISVTVKFDPTATSVFGDVERLQQVVSNLLTNAIKFTPQGGAIKIITQRRGSHIEISVEDTGQGIEEEFLPYIFERFRQADASSTRKHGGLGLGLSIVKQLIDLHGGAVSVESEGAGRGAKFTIALPLVAMKTKPVEVSERPAPGHMPAVLDFAQVDLKDVKVLVVEDEAGSRELIKTVLEICKAEVLVAESAQEALDILKDNVPNVIVSDVGMPDMDGYDFIKKVRELSICTSVPAIALTAFVRDVDRDRAIRSGFNAHIAKPAEPESLVKAIAELIDLGS